MNTKTLILVLAAMGASLLSYVAGAAPPPNPAPQARVVLADLDLTSASGQVTLERRLAVAARRVCAPLEGRGVRLHHRWRACLDRAASRALQEVREKRVAANAVRHATGCSAPRQAEIRSALDGMR